ncbi:MAG: glycerate kinase [Acetobacteraceae bacterium]|nr:glycerate kinase [Acetobacteraceae bacterium]
MAPEALLRRAFEAAVAAADPRRVLPAHLPRPPAGGRIVVVGAGKSAAPMAAAVEEAWNHLPLSGLVVTRTGHAVPTRRIEVVEASHPVPDAAGEAAARRILSLVSGLAAEDLVLALISGGGSALLSLPAPGLTLADMQAVNRALLASGATIHEMNCVRKHLSAIAGGRLAAAAFPARLVALAISDVPGDDPSVIASGPTVPDPTTFAEARAILARYRIAPPEAVAAHLAAAAEETPKPGDPRLSRQEFRLIATPALALSAAARAAPVPAMILGDSIEGEAREVGRVLAGIALSVHAHGQPGRPPLLLLSGGETVVTIRHAAPGRGGRNSECLLGFALALERAGAAPIHALMADTDGVDGAGPHAGAWCGPGTLPAARAAGQDPAGALARHDSAAVFAAAGTLVETGPTLTNVNDFRAVLVG